MQTPAPDVPRTVYFKFEVAALFGIETWRPVARTVTSAEACTTAGQIERVTACRHPEAAHPGGRYRIAGCNDAACSAPWTLEAEILLCCHTPGGPNESECYVPPLKPPTLCQ